MASPSSNPSFSIPNYHPRLLSESSFLQSDSSLPAFRSRSASLTESLTGPGGDDLSLSELSLNDRAVPGRGFEAGFSLLARPNVNPEADESDSVHARDTSEAGRDEVDLEEAEVAGRNAAALREEKLQSDLHILRQLNTSFAGFTAALHEVGSANEHVAKQLAETDALLNRYVGILAQSEEFSKLIFDEGWMGAEADIGIVEQEYLMEKERLKREKEEQELAAQRERERLEREEQERAKRAEQEVQERLERERAALKGVRGVRGTRASTRAARGVTRTAPGGMSSSRTQSSAGSGLRRPPSSAVAQPGAAGTSTRGLATRRG